MGNARRALPTARRALLYERRAVGNARLAFHALVLVACICSVPELNGSLLELKIQLQN
jgi:hypothetical protein